MTCLTQRQRIIGNIHQACAAGARLHRACAVANITLNSWYRWQEEQVVLPDARPTACREQPANQLTEEERQDILTICNNSQMSSLPPSQIVPRLADQGQYIASESTFYRVLRQAGQTQHRGQAKAPRQVHQPTSHTATAPNQVWSWDITWLPSNVKGQFFKLYLIEDIFSRYPVGWEVHHEETGELAAELLQRSVLNAGGLARPLVLHSDNGASMKSFTLKAKLEALGIATSFSRPRVSNDNPYSESLFRTLKYWPQWPKKGFKSIDQAREWVARFIHWYSNEHRHSGIRFVTPSQRHRGQDQEILKQRRAVYQRAKEAHPERWSGKTRDWSWIDEVQLNPDRKTINIEDAELMAA